MNATKRPNTATFEASTVKCGDGTDFNETVTNLGIDLEELGLTQIAEGIGKKLFCRLPGTIKSALQARLSCGRAEAAKSSEIEQRTSWN